MQIIFHIEGTRRVRNLAKYMGAKNILTSQYSVLTLFILVEKIF